MQQPVTSSRSLQLCPYSVPPCEVEGEPVPEEVKVRRFERAMTYSSSFCSVRQCLRKGKPANLRWRFGCRMKLLNQAQARNTLIKYATGDVVSFIDADDKMHPQVCLSVPRKLSLGWSPQPMHARNTLTRVRCDFDAVASPLQGLRN